MGLMAKARHGGKVEGEQDERAQKQPDGSPAPVKPFLRLGQDLLDLRGMAEALRPIPLGADPRATAVRSPWLWLALPFTMDDVLRGCLLGRILDADGGDVNKVEEHT